jgi:molybdate transport system substrate-binding protein
MLVSCYRFATISVAIFLAVANVTAADADELKIWTARAITTVLDKVGHEFEHSSGYKLNVTTDTSPPLVKRIYAGESFDILVQPTVTIDALINAGKILADTRTHLVRSGIGVEVPLGARKPDITSVEALKRALLDAKSIAFLKEGSGIYMEGLIERLGIAEAIKLKITRPDRDVVSELVASGEIDLGIVAITQILTTPGVQYVGPLRPEVQSYITFTGGISANSHAPNVARDLFKFLTGPTAIPVVKSQGMEPG